MTRVVTVAVCCLLLLDGASRLVHPQSHVFPLAQERSQARHLFEELIRVAALPAGIEVSFSVLESADLIAAFVEQGCYALVARDGHLLEAFRRSPFPSPRSCSMAAGLGRTSRRSCWPMRWGICKTDWRAKFLAATSQP